MAGSNYVAYNLAQVRSDSEKAQARNNIGAAALASLAASFESRAPSYNWSANEVCTYGGKLWQFDANHSGAWTGADAHEVSINDLIGKYELDIPLTNSEIFDYIEHNFDEISSEITLNNSYSLEYVGAPRAFRFFDDKKNKCIYAFISLNSSVVNNSSTNVITFPNSYKIIEIEHSYDFAIQSSAPAGTNRFDTGYPCYFAINSDHNIGIRAYWHEGNRVYKYGITTLGKYAVFYYE